jgi:DNA-binding CsgD family transcriptional regulator
MAQRHQSDIGATVIGISSDYLSISNRQTECLAWMARGKSAWDIADLLGIPQASVDAHIKSACERLGVRTPFQAVIICAELGLI